MKLRMLMFIMLVVLAACGGGDSVDTALPTQTPEPTLTMDERAEFTAGTIENPLRMTIRPTSAIRERVELVVAVAANARFEAVTGDAELRADLGLPDDLAVLAEPLQRDFNVTIADVESVVTVDDLVDAVQFGVAEQAAAAIFEVSRLYVEVIPVDIPGEGLSGVCDTGGGIVTIPWLDGITLAASQALNCGDPGLLVAVAEEAPDLFVPIDYVEPEPTPEVTPESTAEVTAEATGEATPDATIEPADEPADEPEPTEESTPEATAEATPESTAEATPEATAEATPDAPIGTISGELVTGDVAVIITSNTLGSLGALQGRPFCRVSINDLYGWLIPNLIFERSNINVGEVIDVADTTALIDAVANGDCAGAGLSLSVFNALEDSDGVVVVEATVPIPLGVLVYPVEVALGERVNFNESLPELAADLEASRPLRLLLGQDALLPVEPAVFAALNAFIETTGVDLARLAE